MKKIEQPWVKVVKKGDVTVHPSASEAYLFSQNLTLQIQSKNLATTILNQPSFEFPIGCIVNKRVQIFANWRNLLINPVDDQQSITVLLFNKRLSQEVQYQAWLYVMCNFSLSLHKNFILSHLFEFLDNCPAETQVRLFKNTDTSRSMSALSNLLNVSRSSLRNAKTGKSS
ncbi:MAG: hypothetical protein ACI84K_001255 [Pseudohongiellaceae bacterium]|jgi:hypothetical protein